MDYDVILYVLVIRMAGRKWELQTLFRGTCYILPCFHPYGTYKAIVELSVGDMQQNKLQDEICRAAQVAQHTDSLYQTGLG